MAKSINSPFAVAQVTMLSQDTKATKLMHTVVKAALQEPSEAYMQEDTSVIGGDTARLKPYNEHCIDLCGVESLEVIITDMINQQLGTNKPFKIQLVFK